MRWWQVVAAIVALQYLVALSIGAIVGFYYVIPIWRLSVAAFGIATIGLLSYAFFRVGRYAILGESNPLARLAGDLRGKIDFPAVLFLVAAQMAVLSWLKSTMPYAVGFWADPLLADVDAVVFGRDPWTLMQGWPEWAGLAIDRIYVTWGFVAFGTMVALSLAPETPTRNRAIIGYFMVVGSSAVLQYLLPSAGPIFYEAVGHGTRFAELPVRPWVSDTANYLWTNYTVPGGRVGGGISAMPSVHVGTVAWLAIAASAYFPRLRLLAWGYFAAIIIGSVYLGWHYAIDGIAALGIALLAWCTAPFLLRVDLKTGRFRRIRISRAA